MQANFLDLAKQGDPHAIATLMNQALTSQGVTVQAAMRRGCLHILMESDRTLEPSRIVPALRKAMQDLQSPVISRVRIYGHQKSGSAAIWSQVIDLSEDLSQPLTITSTNLVNTLDDEPPTAIRAALVRSNGDGSVALKTFAPATDHSTDHLMSHPITAATSVLISPPPASTLPAPPLPAALRQEPQPEFSSLQPSLTPDSPIPPETQPPEAEQNGKTSFSLPVSAPVQISPPSAGAEVLPEAEILPEAEVSPEADLEVVSSPYEHPTLSKTQSVSTAARKPQVVSSKRSSSFASWGVGGAFVCGIALGSWFLWKQPLAKTDPQQPLAEDIVRQIPKLESAQNVADLESQASQIQASLDQLTHMPATADIQKQVGLLQGQLGQVRQRLGNEREAKTNLLTAQRLGDEAEAALKASPKDGATNTAQQKLQTAIRLLEVSPAKTFVSPDIEAVLTRFQGRLAQLQPSPQASPQASAKASAQKTVATSTPTPQTSSPPPAKAATPTGPVQVGLNATGQSWLQVTADGKILFEGIVDRGIQKTWQAKTELIVRVGNAGFVVASFASTPPKPLGELGDVLEVKYSAKGVTSKRLK